MSTSFRDFLTVLALSLHAIFEGLAVGLEDDAEGVWVLFAAVCSHKFVMSFCIGVELGRMIHLIICGVGLAGNGDTLFSAKRNRLNGSLETC